ncbi:ABC transporter substrate-binding protein [Planosporangium sp. 12N6]|uniref:ABC transporter substrate-binding protein n=1 Tax=Planosporangium spinosum TaxID=3402278 RepID=UPI003CEF49CC
MLGLAAAPGLLAACGGDDKDGGSAATGELLIWYWGEQEAAGMKGFFEGAVDDYNKAGTDTAGKARAVLQESDSLYTAFRTAAKAKKGPDVQFFWGGTQALEDVWAGRVAPLDDYLSRGALDNANKDVRRETNWDGKQWGLPFYEINTAWAYNKKMFAKAGLDPENPPTTWDEFIAALTALKRSGVTPLGAGFKDAYLGGWLVSYFGAQNFDSIDEAVAPFRGDAAYDGDKYLGWLDRIKELIDRGFFNDDVLSLDLYQGQQLFESQKVAITNSVQPQIVGWERKLGTDTVGVMLSPAWGSGKLARFFPGASQVLTITSFSPRKERAAKFLEHLHDPAVMKAMYDACGAVSPDAKFDPAWLTSDIDKQMAKLKGSLPTIWYQYYYPFPFERDGVTPGVQQLFQPGGSVKTAAKMMQDAIEKWKREQPAQVKAYKQWKLLA